MDETRDTTGGQGPAPRRPAVGAALAGLSATTLLAGTLVAGTALAGSPPDGELPRWSAVAVGLGHTCAVRAGGTLWCWGHNDSGQLGDGTTTGSALPVRIGSQSSWVGIAAGDRHTCGIREDASLWCWGADPSAPPPVPGSGTVPERIGQGTGWRSVLAHGSNTCAIDVGEDLWCWGDNSHGQVGDGTTTPRPGPVRVLPEGRTAGDSRWTEISPGDGFTCGTRSDDSLWCWGANEDGAVGDGTETDQYRPVRIDAGTRWTTVRAGHDHACALQDNGIAWCWGDNSDGQLGTSTYFPVPLPVPVLDRGTWSGLTAGQDFTCALRPDSTLWCWGTNEHGELAASREDLVTAGVPLRAPGDEVWRTLSAGAGTACGLHADGTLWCWGANRWGQIGDGTLENRTAPTPVGLPPRPDRRTHGLPDRRPDRFTDR